MHYHSRTHRIFCRCAENPEIFPYNALHNHIITRHTVYSCCSPLQCVAMSSIDQAVSKLRDTFISGKTRSYAWRVAQLQALQQLMKENEAALVEALNKDLGRHVFEASGLDLVPINMELAEVLSNLKYAFFAIVLLFSFL